jgi:hypothetical protein
MLQNDRHLIKKTLSRFGLGAPFSMLTRPSLLQPKRAASSTPFQRIDDSDEFQIAFLRTNGAGQKMTEIGLQAG